VASSLYSPHTVDNVFGNWLHDIYHMDKILIQVAEVDFLWSVWICRNERFLMIIFFSHVVCTLSSVVFCCLETGTMNHVDEGFLAVGEVTKYIFIPHEGGIIYGLVHLHHRICLLTFLDM
jgi:hypothetical protein